MAAKRKLFYQVHLEVSLKKAKRIFGFINISNIPYTKFEEIFAAEIPEGRKVFQDATGYQISQELYNAHKAYLDKNISFTFNFKLFNYGVGLTGDELSTYQPDYYKELPF